MPEDQSQPIFEMDLGDAGGRVSFATADVLFQWNVAERGKWAWVNQGGSPMTDWILSFQNQFYGRVEQFVQSWRQCAQRSADINGILSNLRNAFNEAYIQERILNSADPKAEFIFKLREKRGDRIAAGAYAALLKAPIQTGGQSHPEFYEGMIEAFLFNREIDWTATGHQEVLNRLKNLYNAEIERQDGRFKEVEEKNRLLNSAFESALGEKNNLLQELHNKQSSDFTNLIEKHVKNLEAIEKTYDQKLSLQKPVKYWQTKEVYHRKRAINFGCVALASVVVAAVGLGLLAHEYLGKLTDVENPKHWQIGVMVIGAFFSVWLVRVFVRLFFSHVHLATDAAERRMMILTYLSMSREGAQFGPDDKKLIVQHIFRAASDGLVKDDAAPPTLFEMVTRK
jgi:hypothetical protein